MNKKQNGSKKLGENGQMTKAFNFKKLFNRPKVSRTHWQAYQGLHFATTGVLLLVVAFAPILSRSAFAQDYNFSNNTTGSDSTNINNGTVTSTNSSTINDTSNTNNTLNVSINGGSNIVSNNTTIGPVSIGGISTSVSIANNSNSTSNITAANNTSNTNTDLTSSNYLTGPSSTNTNTNNITNSTSTIISQFANITNGINLNISSGHNTFSNNTKLENITIGGVKVAVTITNNANTTPVSGKGGGNPPVTPVYQQAGETIADALAIVNPNPTTLVSASFFPSGGDGFLGLILVLGFLLLGLLPESQIFSKLFRGRPVLATSYVARSTKIISSIKS